LKTILILHDQDAFNRSGSPDLSTLLYLATKLTFIRSLCQQSPVRDWCRSRQNLSQHRRLPCAWYQNFSKQYLWVLFTCPRSKAIYFSSSNFPSWFVNQSFAIRLMFLGLEQVDERLNLFVMTNLIVTPRWKPPQNKLIFIALKFLGVFLKRHLIKLFKSTNMVSALKKNKKFHNRSSSCHPFLTRFHKVFTISAIAWITAHLNLLKQARQVSNLCDASFGGESCVLATTPARESTADTPSCWSVKLKIDYSLAGCISGRPCRNVAKNRSWLGNVRPNKFLTRSRDTFNRFCW
jgi:hypothetical protein